MTPGELQAAIEERRAEVEGIQRNQRTMRGKSGQRAQIRLATLQAEINFMLHSYNEAVAAGPETHR